MPRCCLCKCLYQRQSNKEGWWNTRGPVLEAIHEAELSPAGAWRNWEPNPGRAHVPGAGVFTMERLSQDHLEQASPGAHLHKTCLYFSTESNDSASSVVEATMERKQIDAFCEVSHRPAKDPMWKSWILVFQTRKQGVGIPPQAPQDLAKLPGQGDPSIPQCEQSLLDLPSGGWGGAWDICKGNSALVFKSSGFNAKD